MTAALNSYENAIKIFKNQKIWFVEYSDILEDCGHINRAIGNYEKAIEAFKEARSLFKRNKEVIHVARCDQKMASCLIELGEGELALETARKAVDVFETGHDHRRETFASFEFGKAQILLEKYDEGLATL